jgi:clan AA aspartic protease (TIGR02281 family)
MLLILAAPAPAACKLAKFLEFPVTMVNMRALTTARINDHDVEFTIDSGAFYSMLSGANAAELGLKTHIAPYGFYVIGANGAASVSVATVRTLTIAGASVHDVDFLVGGSDGFGGVGLLGQNFLHIGDAEYDLAQGVVRLIKPEDCRKGLLAYWVKANESYSDINIEPTSRERFATIGSAYLNGAEIRVEFDTGAPTSLLSLQAAARAGIKPDSPGVVPAGESGGIGRGVYMTYIAPFASFKIGDEEIKNTHLRFGGIKLPNTDMLIGADFFLSHHIYVANSQHKLYFTYNGGPVFNLATTKLSRVATDSAGADGAKPPGADGTDAAELSRRGQALSARRDFEHALADLDQACQLAPENADYVYQRGAIRRSLGQSGLAIADFDQAIKLKPDDADALLARAGLRAKAGDKAGAGADLDAADAVLPKETDTRFALAEFYEHIDRLESATNQFDLWIASHGEDFRLPEALDGRCRTKALRGADLAGALKDCNVALRRAKSASPFYAEVAASRGLVLLRLGEYHKSIADYDASLKINAKNPLSLYGRGIDKNRLNKSSEGQADMEAATKIWAQVSEEFERRGIVP